MSRTRTIAVAAMTAIAVLGTVCTPGGLNASSSCKDYIAADANAQVTLVGNLYHKAHPQEPASGPGAMNAVMNVGYECSQRPDVAVGDLGDFR
jgi:hypothetical protein